MTDTTTDVNDLPEVRTPVVEIPGQITALGETVGETAGEAGNG